jgi:hypothetical protein
VSKAGIPFAISDSVTAEPVAPDASGSSDTMPGFLVAPVAAEFASTAVMIVDVLLIAVGA